MDKKTTENVAIRDLIRRVEATYRIRINAAIRLRDSYDHNKKMNFYYSALITGVSIITIGFNVEFLGFNVSNIVLMLSIVLSYFAFYVSEQNLQERAYRMEETYRALDKLGNQLAIYFNFNDQDKCSEEVCKKMYQKYENIISNIENHLAIDFKRYLLQQYGKKEGACSEESYITLKKEIEKHDSVQKLKIAMQYIIPTVSIIFIIAFSVK